MLVVPSAASPGVQHLRALKSTLPPSSSWFVVMLELWRRRGREREQGQANRIRSQEPTCISRPAPGTATSLAATGALPGMSMPLYFACEGFCAVRRTDRLGGRLHKNPLEMHDANAQ